MSTQIDRSNQQDINEIIRKNFDSYFQEVEKVMPQYLQSFTKLQDDFLEAWKKIVNSSIDAQKEFVKNIDIQTNIPQEMVSIMQSVSEECIKAKNIQNKTILSAMETTRNNLKNNDAFVESITKFNKEFFNHWANIYSKNK